MKVEATSTSSPQDKGKGPEQIITPVKNIPIDLDQSFDAAENMLDNTQQKNTLHFEHETVNTIETVLNITSISPEQADIINNNKYKNPLDDMEEEDNEVVTAGIDISKSIIRQQESQITELQLENSILKSNLSDNYEKLNNALVAVAQMQRLLVYHELLPENRLINITELIKPTFSDYFNVNNIDHIYCSDKLAIDIHTATIIDVDENFTDHNIATTSFYISELVPQSNKVPAKKIFFHYNKMSHND
ncbi:8917_t:CDS:2 [Funneliformis geosporum]|nr:8917_t:CDS:2 [Funneliformis geosporum]